MDSDMMLRYSITGPSRHAVCLLIVLEDTRIFESSVYLMLRLWNFVSYQIIEMPRLIC